MGGYSLAISEFAKKAGNNAELVVKKAIIDVGTRIVERSPVGDATLWKSKPPPGYIGGRFRANWQYGNTAIGVPSEELPDIDGSPGQENVSTQRITLGVMDQPMALIHTLINNLPYGIPLEDGWSSQAPAGMVGLTVMEWQSIVDSAAQSEVK